MFWRIDLICLELNKIVMIDAWTQTSNKGSEAGDEETKESLHREESSLNGKTTDNSFYSTKVDDSPLSLFKRYDPSASTR